MTSHYFCHILFIGSKSMNPKGGDFTRARITEGRNHWGTISEAASHTSGLAYIEERVYQPIWLRRSVTVFFSSKVTIYELLKLWKFQVNYVNSWLIDILSSLSWAKLSRDSTAQIFLPKAQGTQATICHIPRMLSLMRLDPWYPESCPGAWHWESLRRPRHLLLA